MPKTKTSPVQPNSWMRGGKWFTPVLFCDCAAPKCSGAERTDLFSDCLWCGRRNSGLFFFRHSRKPIKKEQHLFRCCSWCDRGDSNLWPLESENCDTQTKTNDETYILLGLHKQKTKNTRMKKLIPMRVHGFCEGPFTPVVKWWSTDGQRGWHAYLQKSVYCADKTAVEVPGLLQKNSGSALDFFFESF